MYSKSTFDVSNEMKKQLPKKAELLRDNKRKEYFNIPDDKSSSSDSSLSVTQASD